jgi:hypothetical protein
MTVKERSAAGDRQQPIDHDNNNDAAACGNSSDGDSILSSKAVSVAVNGPHIFLIVSYSPL